MKKETVGIEALAIVGLVGVLIYLTGCGSTSGWQFGFGVYPVTQIHNVQSLQGNQRVTVDTERKVARGNRDEY